MAIKDSKGAWLDDACEACAGTGKVIRSTPKLPIKKINPPDCAECDGTGRKPKSKGAR